MATITEDRLTDCQDCEHHSFVITDRGGSSYGESTEAPWVDGYCSCGGEGEEGDDCRCEEGE